jgi:hypothetical protein
MNEDRRYTSDEVSAIVKRALANKRGAGDVSHEELLEIAAHAGLEVEDVSRAIAEETHAASTRDREERRMARRRHSFQVHFRTYVIVNAMLLLIDLLTPGGPWFFWPALCWGVGLALHASNTFFPKPDRRV